MQIILQPIAPAAPPPTINASSTRSKLAPCFWRCLRGWASDCDVDLYTTAPHATTNVATMLDANMLMTGQATTSAPLQMLWNAWLCAPQKKSTADCSEKKKQITTDLWCYLKRLQTNYSNTNWKIKWFKIKINNILKQHTEREAKKNRLQMFLPSNLRSTIDTLHPLTSQTPTTSQRADPQQLTNSQ